MYIIGVARLNNINSEALSSEDVYALVTVYYTAFEEKDDTPCGRYLFFMKGNIIFDEKLIVRGEALIFSNNDKESLYYTPERDRKLAFSCIIKRCANFLVILVEKIDHVFFIDSNEQFSKLDIFSTWPKHDFKVQEHKGKRFIKGMTWMKNMLPFERHSAGDKTSALICS